MPDVSSFTKDPTMETTNGVEQISDSGCEPIAVIGFSFKFPQGLETPDSLWQALLQKKSAMTEFPKTRINLDGFYDPDIEKLNTFPVRGGHFIEGDIAAFDAPFFAISPSEAEQMDPLQRGILESSYRALENAGVPLSKATGSNTAVYTGSFGDDYKAIYYKDLESQGQYTASGLGPNMIANKVSWFFDFRGPSVNLDTACSSSLVAMHLACRGLLANDFSMALVGGCSLIFGPETIRSLNNGKFLSPSSRCFSFDHRADGYSRGEGFGVLVIKRLSDAILDGNTIRAVIRGTGSNQDGRTPGITQPSQDAQEQLIRDTYKRSGLGLDMTRYFEAHGTGTKIGDPIEAGAIGAAFGSHRSPSDPLFCGSIKANIGHLEGASGIAGLIKSILILERGIIPPNCGFERVNPSIKDQDFSLKFPKESTPWPSNVLRRISLNSFGFGGTNAHIILDDAYHYLTTRELAASHNTISNSSFPEFGTDEGENFKGVSGRKLAPTPSLPKLLTFSAMDEEGVKRISSAYSAYFQNLTESTLHENYLEQLAYTLNERRSALIWKSFLVVNSTWDLQRHDLKISKPVPTLSAPTLGFCFTGQGAQWAGMGKELLSYPAFKESLLDMDSCLRDLGCPWSLEEEITRDENTSCVNYPSFAQPLCTAVQIALVDLLSTFGISPLVVVGHSSGEIAAAYTTGSLNRASAIKVAYFRGQLTQRLAKNLSTPMAMLAVGLSESEVIEYLEKITFETNNRVGISIGCINSPKSVTLTGRQDQLLILKGQLELDNIFTRKLAVNIAYHSSFMETLIGEYVELMGTLSGRDLQNPAVMVSSVTVEAVLPNELVNPSYWARNMTSMVRFSEALTSACLTALDIQDKTKTQSQQVDFLLEIGPHSALKMPIKETIGSFRNANPIEYSSALIRSVNSATSLLEALGQLCCHGYSMDFYEINQQGTLHSTPLEHLVDLPEYPFDHSRSYWRESRISRGYRFRKAPPNQFLGTRVSDWNSLEARWHRTIKLSDDQWLQDHKIHGVVLYPGAAMLVMAIEAAKQIFEAKSDKFITGYTMKDVTFHQSLALTTDPKGLEVEFLLRTVYQPSELESPWSEFRLYFFDTDEPTEICRGCIRVHVLEDVTEVDQGRELNAESRLYQSILREGIHSCPIVSDTHSAYSSDNIGLGFGPAFQTVTQASYNHKGEAVADIKLHQWHSRCKSGEMYRQPSVIHPTSLDGLIQLPLLAIAHGGKRKVPSIVPRRIKKIWVSQTGLSDEEIPTVKAYNKTVEHGPGSWESTVIALDCSGSEVKVKIEGYEKIALGDRRNVPDLSSEQKPLCFNVDHRPDVDLLNQVTFGVYLDSITEALPSPLEFNRELKIAMRLFLLRALENLSSIDTKAMLPHQRQYIRWMKHEKEKLDAESLINFPDWQKHLHDDYYLKNLSARLESANKTGKFYIEVGRNLTQILRGEVNPLNLFFTEDLVMGYYHEFYTTTNANKAFSVFLDALSHKQPRLRILDIGAGTGSAASRIVRTLTTNEEGTPQTPKFAHYEYTDISPSFFKNAEAIFKGCEDRVSFKILDIERDPIKQGFRAESYDLIIADNVLHATENLAVSLANVRKLLKPGGRIALGELTDPEKMKTNFAFGLLPGWWRANDKYRALSAGVSREVWNDLFLQTGFSGIQLTLPDFYDDECHEHSVLVSTAILPLDTLSVDTRTVYIITTPRSQLQKEIADLLTEEFLNLGFAKCLTTSLAEIATIEASKIICIALFELDGSLLDELCPENFTTIRNFITMSEEVLWVTLGGGDYPEQPKHTLISGLARAVRQEHPMMKFITLLFAPGNSVAGHFFRNIMQVHEQTASVAVDDYEPEFVERAGMLCIPRVVEDYPMSEKVSAKGPTQQHEMKSFGMGPPLALSIKTTGLLDTLEFLEDHDQLLPLAPDEVEIETQASGMNFRDCLIALGRIPGGKMGFECSGYIRRVGEACKDTKVGDRVCGFINGSFQTFTRCKELDTIQLPEDMSFAEGAAMPLAFCTAYYALVMVARIQESESILIHSAAGGTGQAAIQIAMLYKAEIYVTVGSAEKKKLLMDLYGIPEDHIFYSRNTTFARGIKRMTRSRGGVDVVLNSLSGDFLVQTWECMASFGRFLEIGKKDILDNGSLPMFPFAKNVSFHAIDLNDDRGRRPQVWQELKDAVASLLFDKKINPSQPLHVYGVGKIESAFRYLQSGKNTGKTVVEMRPEDVVQTRLDIKPKWVFDPIATYLIAGGLGGIGRSAARWMVKRGARHLILLSRFGPRNDAARKFLEDLHDQGIQVEAPACDISNLEALRTTLTVLATRMPQVKGCIQSTMLLRDAIFQTMTPDQWTQCLLPKVWGTKNLHELLPLGMDFFIMFSSLAGILGSSTQANYSAGCCYQDALAHYRVGTGEKATTLNLGLMVDDGVLTENDKIMAILKSTGYLIGIKQQELYALLEHHCDPNLPLSTPLKTQVLIGIDFPASLTNKHIHSPTFMRRPPLRNLYNIPYSSGESTAGTNTSSEPRVSQLLSDVTSLEGAARIICNELMKRLSKALAMPLENLDPTKALHVYGVDSLVAVEIRNWFLQAVDADVAIFEILGNASFEDISMLVASKSRVVLSILGMMENDAQSKVEGL